MTKPVLGIFDSGIGGLTLAHALVDINPHISFVYYGDTAHLPYGDKTPELVQHYSHGIAHFLVEAGCSAILIACNTASANATTSLQAKLPSNIPVFNVIDPVVNYVREKYTQENRIAVIGTRGTISSGVYADRIRENNANPPEVISLATPLLAPMIEEGFFNHTISDQLIADYLETFDLDNIDAIVLGCTHYPLIKQQVRSVLGPDVEIIDSASIVAQNLSERWKLESTASPQYQFFVSDLTEAFSGSARYFFQDTLTLEEKDIWKHEKA